MVMKIDYEKLRNFCLKYRYEKLLIIEKDSERYIFLYDNDSSRELFQQLGKYAANPEFSFTWRDAAILSQKARKIIKERETKVLGIKRNNLLRRL